MSGPLNINVIAPTVAPIGARPISRQSKYVKNPATHNRRIAKTANDARRAACLREVQGGSTGVRLEDVHAAVSHQLESLASMLSPANAHRFLTSLPQDVDVVRVEAISRRTTARMHRYVQAA